jgi:hypothetical protein
MGMDEMADEGDMKMRRGAGKMKKRQRRADPRRRKEKR